MESPASKIDSDDEKRISSGHTEDHIGSGKYGSTPATDLLPDPDAHLSPEERARIVS